MCVCIPLTLRLGVVSKSVSHTQILQMQTLGHSVLGFYHRFLRLSIRFLLFMDFTSTFKFLTQASELSCGILLLGYFSRLFNLIGLLLIFVFCLKIFDFFGGPTPRFRSHPVPPKIETFEPHPPKPSPNCKGSGSEDEKDDNSNLEDEVLDVMSLRELVKMERQRFNAACAEIEKERVAAASAAEETMAMILRLQSEKSSVEIQANQFRRMVEQKLEYDLEVIESLRWTVVQLESQKNLLEDQLGVYKEKLRQFVEDEEIEEIEELDGDEDANSDFLNFCVEYDVDPSLQTHSHTPQSQQQQQQQQPL